MTTYATRSVPWPSEASFGHIPRVEDASMPGVCHAIGWACHPSGWRRKSRNPPAEREIVGRAKGRHDQGRSRRRQEKIGVDHKWGRGDRLRAPDGRTLAPIEAKR